MEFVYSLWPHKIGWCVITKIVLFPWRLTWTRQCHIRSRELHLLPAIVTGFDLSWLLTTPACFSDIILISLQVLNEILSIKWTLLCFTYFIQSNSIQILYLTVWSAKFAISINIRILDDISTCELIYPFTLIFELQCHSKIIIEFSIWPCIGVTTSRSSLLYLIWMIVVYAPSF